LPSHYFAFFVRKKEEEKTSKEEEEEESTPITSTSTEKGRESWRENKRQPQNRSA